MSVSARIKNTFSRRELRKQWMQAGHAVRVVLQQFYRVQSKYSRDRLNKPNAKKEANRAEKKLAEKKLAEKKLARSETSRDHLGDSYDAVCVDEERKTALAFCEILLSRCLLHTDYFLTFADELSSTGVAFS